MGFKGEVEPDLDFLKAIERLMQAERDKPPRAKVRLSGSLRSTLLEAIRRYGLEVAIEREAPDEMNTKTSDLVRKRLTRKLENGCFGSTDEEVLDLLALSPAGAFPCMCADCDGEGSSMEWSEWAEDFERVRQTALDLRRLIN